MRVFLTGATGHVGEYVLEAFLRAGHVAEALVRHSGRSETVARRGATPIVGDLDRPESYVTAAERADAIVHVAFDRSPLGREIDVRAVHALLESARRRSEAGAETVFVYTSSAWVLGNTAATAAEDAPINPTPFAAWRVEHERIVLEASGWAGLRTAVIRPGIVYGGRRGIVADLLRDAANGLVRTVGSGANHWACVYVRDLADLYVRVCTQPAAAGLFYATDEADETVEDIVESIARHVRQRPDVRRVPLAEARSKMGPYADALALDQRIRCVRARALGWSPTLRSVGGNAARLLDEFKARREAA